MSANSLNQYVGAYKGIPIRSKRLDSKQLISLTDLYKANGSRSKYRPDKWLKTPEIQKLLASKAKKLKVKPQTNKKGEIIEVPGVLWVVRGGDRYFQGTFIDQEIGSLYTASVSEDCSQWLDEIFISEKIGEVIRARKVTIKLGDIEIDVYEAPNGEYYLSQTQVANIIGKEENNFREFLRSKSLEALPYKGYKFVKIQEVEAVGRPPNAVPIKMAVAFWTKESIKGNIEASRLLGACAVETIERRADKAFGKLVTDEQYNNRFQAVRRSIIANCPKGFAIIDKPQMNVVLFPGKKKDIKRIYPEGVIDGFNKSTLVDKLALLSTHYPEQEWKLTPGLELSYKLGKLSKTKYPDLVSGVIQLGQFTGVFIYQIYDPIVDYQQVEECVSRRYIQIAREALKVDYVALFLVSPLGATTEANLFIQEKLPDGKNGCSGFVGVLTVKQLAEFYCAKAISSRSQSFMKGKIAKKFKPLTEYKIRSQIEEVVYQFALPIEPAS